LCVLRKKKGFSLLHGLKTIRFSIKIFGRLSSFIIIIIIVIFASVFLSVSLARQFYYIRPRPCVSKRPPPPPWKGALVFKKLREIIARVRFDVAWDRNPQRWNRFVYCAFRNERFFSWMCLRAYTRVCVCVCVCERVKKKRIAQKNIAHINISYIIFT